MTTFLLILGVMLLFIVAIVSPHAAGKIQKRTNEKATWLKRCSNWLWDPLTWWAKKSIETSRKVLVIVAQWGKRLRRRLPF